MIFDRYTFMLCAFFSVLASIWSIYNGGILNSDGAVYLAATEAFSYGGWEEAFKVHHKPFYSACIYYLSSFLSVNYLAAAHIINSVLFVIGCCSFVYIVKESSQEKKDSQFIVFFSFLYIGLFASWNELREDVYRDFGLWAFTLLAIFFSIRFEKQKNIFYLAACLLAQLFSGLFKTEGYLFVLAPVVIFIAYFKVYLGLKNKIFLAAVIALLLFVIAFSIVSVGLLGEFKSVFVGLESSLRAMEIHVLNKFSSEYAAAFFLSGSLLVVIFEIIKNLDGSLLFLLLVIFLGGSKRKIPVALVSYFSVAFFIILFFFFESQFLVSRYVTLASLSLSLIIIIYRFSDDLFVFKRYRLMMIIASIAVFADSFFTFGPSRDYALQAKKWIDTNVGQTEKVISNRRGFSYSINKSDNLMDMVVDNPTESRIRKYDYYVYLSRNKVSNDYHDFLKKEIQFSNDKGHSAVIYKVIYE